MFKAFFILAAAISILAVFANSSEKKPWLNQPLTVSPVSGDIMLGTSLSDGSTHNYSIVVAVTMSGGGTRAAAFAYGVLEGLRETNIAWKDQKTTLLDEIDLISGVSAGSALATYFTAFGPEHLSTFKKDFLYANFQGSLIASALEPSNLMNIASPWYGRGDLLVEKFSKLYQDKTFADLPKRPRLLITATDVSRSTSFQFTPDQFNLICSDLMSVPLGFAVGASSSVPVVFSPVTLKNYSSSQDCPAKISLLRKEQPTDTYRMRELYRNKLAYLDSSKRQYIHLVDGAASDNLGLRSVIDRASAGGSISASVNSAPPGSINRLIFVIVNAEVDLLNEVDATQQTPSISDAVNALRISKGLQASAETMEMLNQAAGNWQHELRNSDGGLTQFAPDSQLHVIKVSLRDTPDNTIRQRLMKLATVFYLPRNDVDALIQAGKQTLFSSPEYQTLIQSFH